jgi:hypothetical protein
MEKHETKFPPLDGAAKENFQRREIKSMLK